MMFFRKRLLSALNGTGKLDSKHVIKLQVYKANKIKSFA